MSGDGCDLTVQPPQAAYPQGETGLGRPPLVSGVPEASLRDSDVEDLSVSSAADPEGEQLSPTSVVVEGNLPPAVAQLNGIALRSCGTDTSTGPSDPANASPFAFDSDLEEDDMKEPLPMFVHSNGRSVQSWIAALDRWDKHQRLVRNLNLTEPQYRELLECCFEVDSVGHHYYTANADQWLIDATAAGATKRFLDVTKEAFKAKFGEPTQAENLEWLRLTMDPINQTPNTYAALVRQKGDTMVTYGRANKADVIWKFLRTLPPELQNMMQEFQNVHSPYSGKYDLQFYADRADLIWQTMAQSQLDLAYPNPYMALDQEGPRSEHRPLRPRQQRDECYGPAYVTQGLAGFERKVLENSRD